MYLLQEFDYEVPSLLLTEQLLFDWFEELKPIDGIKEKTLPLFADICEIIYIISLN